MEGESDDFILSFLARRVVPEIEFAEPLIYHGKKKLGKSLPGLLAAFRFGARQGALPILHRDSNGKDPSDVERELRRFCPANVGLLIPVQETEAWLFAEPSLLTRYFPGASPPQASPETLADAKETLRRLASESGLSLTKERLALLLGELDLALLEERCPSFRKFATLLKGLGSLA